MLLLLLLLLLTLVLLLLTLVLLLLLLPSFVTKVKDDSPAAGKIAPFARIFMIDAVDVAAGTKSAAVEALKKSGDDVTFVVSEQPDMQGYELFKGGK